MQQVLGKKVPYPKQYDPKLLFPIPRKEKREELGIDSPLPFVGFDFWRGYELSWLNGKGKPEAAILELKVPAASPYIVESKSLKLYLNSINQTRFESAAQVKATIERDLSDCVKAPLQMKLILPKEFANQKFYQPKGELLDGLDIEINDYHINPHLLKCDSAQTTHECYYSHLLKANCLVTGQPDFATVEIEYKGPKINPEGLLKYLISFREHNEFHEQCVERLFVDIKRCCNPEELFVFAQFTRRGGLDISPYRGTSDRQITPDRASRQ